MPGLLENSDGSAEWTTPRGSRMICSVNGPIEVRLRDEEPQIATLELVFNPHIGRPTIREVLISDKMHPGLNAVIMRERIPRSLVQVVVQVLESSGSFADELIGGLNVANMALASTGSVPMSGLVAGVYLAIQDGEAVEKVEAGKETTSEHAVAFKFTSSSVDVDEIVPQLVLCDSIGDFSEKELLMILNKAESLSLGVYRELSDKITSEVSKSLSSLA